MTAFRVFRRDATAVAAVEFALVVPIILFIMMMIIDFGYAFHIKLKIINGVTAAAQYAVNNGASVTASTATSFMANVRSVAASASGLSTAPTASILLNNAADTSNVSNYYCVVGSPGTWTSTSTSSLPCSGVLMSGKFVTITVAATYRPFFPANPILGNVTTMTESAIARIQ